MPTIGEPQETQQGGSQVQVGTISGVSGGQVNVAGRDVNIYQRITNFIAGDNEQQRGLRNRQNMLELVKNTWIEGVLKPSLAPQAQLALNLATRPQAVENPWQSVVQMPEQEKQALPPGWRILDIFDAMKGGLLILGDPGAGKTTVLLQLAQQAIQRAEDDPGAPVPVVFNLSSWKARQPLGEWLVEELSSKYYIPRKIAQPWVEQDELFVLLDGLDEVSDEERSACVQAINQFRQEHLAPLAVCCRTAEYEELTLRLRLGGAVQLQPVRPQQVTEYLDGLGSQADGLRQALKKDADLLELALSPLILNIMIMAYSDLPAGAASSGAIGNGNDAEASMTRAQLLELYIRQMFHRRSSEQRYTMEETRRWLTELSRRMLAHGQSVFVIESIRSSWLEAQHRRIHSLLVGPLLGALLGLLLGALLALRVEPRGGLLVGLLIGLSVGQAVGRRETPSEILNWSWRKAGLGAVAGLLMGGLIFAGMAGLVLGLNVEALLGLQIERGDVLALGGVQMAIMALLGALVLGLEAAEVKMRNRAGQGVRASLRNALRVGGGFGLAVGLAFGVMLGLRNGPVEGLSGGLVFGLISALPLGALYGGGYAVQHFALRFWLQREGCLPWRSEDFLDFAVERIFLHRVGGGYIFIHRLLMEYLAEDDKPQITNG